MNSKITIGLALVFATAAFSGPHFDHRGGDRDYKWRDRGHLYCKHERMERDRCDRERFEREQFAQQRREAYRIEQERERIALERERIRLEAERDRCRREQDHREAMRESQRPSRPIHKEEPRESRPRISIGVVWHQMFQ